MFAGQVKGLRGADGAVRTLTDVGEYDVWSTVVCPKVPTGELQAFSYGVGASVSGVAAVATKLDTNMRTPNQFVDESMNVYGIAIQPMRYNNKALTGAGPTQAILLDFDVLEEHTLFRFHVGGDKPFAEGRISWFSEGAGFYGADSTPTLVASNGVPSVAAIRRWEYTLPIGRVEKFWGELSWPRVAAATTLQNPFGIVVRLLGVRARGVQ